MLFRSPDALSKAGEIIGGIFGRSAPAAASSGTRAAVTPYGVSAFAAPSFTSAGSAGGAPTIVVQGALDPVAVAKQIRQILTTDQRRRAGVVIA